MKPDNVLRLHKARLRLAVAVNALEVVDLAVSLMESKYVEAGKSKYQTPFINLLFALIARCSRNFDEARYFLQAVADTDDELSTNKKRSGWSLWN
ncbi:MAG: hypothetical protein QW343_02540 [Candidatus Norongarragalinales archaeon]